MQENFQDGVDSIYNACVAKGSTPASQSLSDVVAGIMAIQTGITPSGTINITSNGTKDVTNYASANVNVPNSNSGTYTPTTRSSALDMGATNTYRYVNTNSVPNSNSGTYKATSRSSALDMGAANTYRYVNTSGVTQTGTYTTTTRSTKIDMGATNNYRYINTNGVTNSNSGTYTASSSSTALDMGATNTYRYVNTSALTKVSGNKAISANGTNIDVKSYATVSVSVPNTVSVIVADAFDNRSKSSDYTFTRTSGYAYTIAVHADGGTVGAYGIINSSGTIQSWEGSTDYFSLTKNSTTSFTISKTGGSDNYSGFIFRAL